MNSEEMEDKLKALRLKYSADIKAVHKEYAISNNPYKIGDIITDHFHTIKIERIDLWVSYGEPSCVYTGTQLNKDGSVSKKQDNKNMFQINIGKKP